MAGRKLATYVHVDGAQYGPDSDVPADVAKKITNPDVWADGDESAAYPDGEPSEDWRGAELDAYAAENGVDLSSAKTKAEKVAALAASADQS